MAFPRRSEQVRAIGLTVARLSRHKAMATHPQEGEEEGRNMVLIFHCFFAEVVVSLASNSREMDNFNTL